MTQIERHTNAMNALRAREAELTMANTQYGAAMLEAGRLVDGLVGTPGWFQANAAATPETAVATLQNFEQQASQMLANLEAQHAAEISALEAELAAFGPDEEADGE